MAACLPAMKKGHALPPLRMSSKSSSPTAPLGAPQPGLRAGVEFQSSRRVARRPSAGRRPRSRRCGGRSARPPTCAASRWPRRRYSSSFSRGPPSRPPPTRRRRLTSSVPCNGSITNSRRYRSHRAARSQCREAMLIGGHSALASSARSGCCRRWRSARAARAGARGWRGDRASSSVPEEKRHEKTAYTAAGDGIPADSMSRSASCSKSR